MSAVKKNWKKSLEMCDILSILWLKKCFIKHLLWHGRLCGLEQAKLWRNFMKTKVRFIQNGDRFKKYFEHKSKKLKFLETERGI